MSKKVPLTVYRDGQRIVVGEAVVEDDLSFSAELSPDAPDDVKDVFTPGFKGHLGFSFCGHQEVTYVPPLKLTID